MRFLSVSVLRLRDFRLLLLVRMCMMMALQSQSVIVGWQVFSITHDEFMLGLAGLAEAVPALTCALFAGHVVDISRPHRIYLACVGAIALNTLILLLFAGGIIPLPAHATLLCLYAAVFISGAARSFIMPSSFALLSQIVQRTEMSAASAWLSSGFQIASITGPAVVGLVYGGYGPRTAWMMPVTLTASAFILICAMSHEKRQYRSAERREPAKTSIQAGWKFLLSSRILLSIMALDMFAVLFGGATAMLPAYADKVLHVGSQGLGQLRAAPAFGAVFVALWMAIKPMQHIRAANLLLVVTGFGFCMIGFGLSTSFALSLFMLALSGAFDSVSMIIRGTLVQLLTPDAMRGRVSAVNSMFIISSNEIGAFESGTAAKLMGLVPSVVFGGVGTLVVVAATNFLSPRLRKLSVGSDGEITHKE